MNDDEGIKSITLSILNGMVTEKDVSLLLGRLKTKRTDLDEALNKVDGYISELENALWKIRLKKKGADSRQR